MAEKAEAEEKEGLAEDVITGEVAEKAERKAGRAHEFNKESWNPKTSLGKKVKSGEIDSIDYILDNKLNILEYQITDILMPNLSTDLLLIGQSKGKFGGGQRRVFRQTQKKTKESMPAEEIKKEAMNLRIICDQNWRMIDN